MASRSEVPVLLLSSSARVVTTITLLMVKLARALPLL
jgi:hypothetical protein